MRRAGDARSADKPSTDAASKELEPKSDGAPEPRTNWPERHRVGPGRISADDAAAAEDTKASETPATGEAAAAAPPADANAAEPAAADQPATSPDAAPSTDAAAEKSAEPSRPKYDPLENVRRQFAPSWRTAKPPKKCSRFSTSCASKSWSSTATSDALGSETRKGQNAEAAGAVGFRRPGR